MTTNILVTIIVALVTNTITTDNAVRAPNLFASQDWQGNGIIRPADTKFESTSVIEERRLQFEVEGKAFSELLCAREVSHMTKTFTLQSDWKLVSESTNNLMTATIGSLTFTNTYLTNIALLTNVAFTVLYPTNYSK